MKVVPLLALTLLACRQEVSGVVRSAIDEQPLAGVTVRAHDMGAAVTDEHGRFSLALPAGAHTLSFSGGGVLAGRQRVSTGDDVIAYVAPSAPSREKIDAFLARRAERARSTLGDLQLPARQVALPATIRVWRSSKAGALAPSSANGWQDNSCSPAVEVIELPLEEYVRGVVPHEWIPSWHDESLRAGAVAARTFAVRWSMQGGRWDCADVDDGTVTQVYRDTRNDKADAAIAATAGKIVMRNGAVIMTEYSAENGDPTEFDVDDPTCTGEARFGHGRGMCQWGTQRWATGTCANGPCVGVSVHDHMWMVSHYFPDAEAVTIGATDPRPATVCPQLPASGATISEQGTCFLKHGNEMYWREVDAGQGGHLFWTNAFQSDGPGNWAEWQVRVPSEGSWKVDAFVDPTWGVYEATHYRIGSTDVYIDQGVANGWTPLGEFTFSVGTGRVQLFDNVGSAVADDQHIVADALRVYPAGSPPPADESDPPPAPTGTTGQTNPTGPTVPDPPLKPRGCASSIASPWLLALLPLARAASRREKR